MDCGRYEYVIEGPDTAIWAVGESLRAALADLHGALPAECRSYIRALLADSLGEGSMFELPAKGLPWDSFKLRVWGATEPMIRAVRERGGAISWSEAPGERWLAVPDLGVGE